jgi:endoglucanase
VFREMMLCGGLVVCPSGITASTWPYWDHFAARFVDAQARVIDRDSNDRTTSEGQAYSMFFALVAGDKERFDALLRWTQDNLAAGDLSRQLPAWHWGKRPKADWGVVDSNSASDADLWMAYTLLEAGAAWSEPAYSRLGAALAARIAAEEVSDVPGFGPMLRPAPRGFQPSKAVHQFNASYMPLQLLRGLGEKHPRGPWRRVALRVPIVLQESSARGFALDWIAYHVGLGFRSRPAPVPAPGGSFDAIRVYLWAGMLHPETDGRRDMLDCFWGMRDYMESHPLPPLLVGEDGEIKDPDGGIGFSAALLPFLKATGSHHALAEQTRRLEAAFSPSTGLYGNEARYYEQCLALFATGWNEERFAFDPLGNLILKWRKS